MRTVSELTLRAVDIVWEIGETVRLGQLDVELAVNRAVERIPSSHRIFVPLVLG